MLQRSLWGNIFSLYSIPLLWKVIKHSFSNGLDKQLLTVRSQSSALYFKAWRKKKRIKSYAAWIILNKKLATISYLYAFQQVYEAFTLLLDEYYSWWFHQVLPVMFMINLGYIYLLWKLHMAQEYRACNKMLFNGNYLR